MTKTAAQKPSFLSSILSPLTGAEQLGVEKARLEAFLNAFPGEYCGFHEDGSVAYSDGFLRLLGLSAIKVVEDIQTVLDTGDAAALEGQFYKLEEDGKPFSLKVHSSDGKRMFRLRGAAGHAIDGRDKFNIVWAEDVTEDDDAQQIIARAKDAAEKELGLMQGGLDHLPMPVWLRNANFDLVWVNQAYATLITNTPPETIAHQYEIVISPRSKGRTPKSMAQDALAEGKPQHEDCHLITGGKRKWVNITEMPLPGTRNVLGFARDITREEEIQTELDRHLAANKTLLEQLHSAIALFGPDQAIEFYNSAFAQLWGLDEQYLNSRPKLGDILEKLRESRRLPEEADFRKYKQGWLDMFTRLTDGHEDMLYLPDGSALRLLVVPHPMGGLMMTFEDVTSRLELESSYNTLIAVQKETLDNLSEGVIVYGGDGRVRLWNPSYAQMWRLHPEDLEGNPHISQLVDKKSKLFNEKEWSAARKNLIEQGLERAEKAGRMDRADDIHLRYATVPLPDGGVMVSYYDISDSARVENALREKNAALEAAEQLKTDFLANVSYQLRTPLNAIMGFSEILDHQYFGELNDRQKEYAGGIHEAGERLVSLIDDILDLATIEAGYLELKKAPVDIKALLENLYDLTTEWARKRKLDVKLSCPHNIGNVSADDRRLKQALLNLIRNAINFTPEGGRIDIEAQKSGDTITISIKDTGIGIAEEDLARIFTPFNRGQQPGQHSGAGLGLTLVKNIVELHSGSIDIASQSGKGTIVTVKLAAV